MSHKSFYSFPLFDHESIQYINYGAIVNKFLLIIYCMERARFIKLIVSFSPVLCFVVSLSTQCVGVNHFITNWQSRKASWRIWLIDELNFLAYKRLFFFNASNLIIFFNQSLKKSLESFNLSHFVMLQKEGSLFILLPGKSYFIFLSPPPSSSSSLSSPIKAD